MTAWAELVGALSGAPRLEGAACRGRTWLADLTAKSDADLIEAAGHICGGCRALDTCRAWLDSLQPNHQPSGYVAGRLVEPPSTAAAIDPDFDDEWLLEHLREQGGWCETAAVIAAAARAGISQHRARAARKRVAPVLCCRVTAGLACGSCPATTTRRWRREYAGRRHRRRSAVGKNRGCAPRVLRARGSRRTATGWCDSRCQGGWP